MFASAMRRMWDESSGSDDDCSRGSDWCSQFMLATELKKMQLREEGMRAERSGSSRVYHPTRVRSSTSEDDRGSSASLSSLDEVTIPELFLKKRHRGKVVYGKFCVEPVIRQSVNDIVTVLVDTSANSIRVIMTKLFWHTAPTTFAFGEQVAIKEPLMEMCSDGMYALRVTSLAQVVCLDNVDKDSNSTAKSKAGHGTLLEDLDKIRSEGNRFFAEENWDAAVDEYSTCISRALQKLDTGESPKTASRENFNHILMLAYSNRAEAKLRLEHYEDALSDADKALIFDPKHVKTLVRKGKAAHGLGLYEISCNYFKAALEVSPGEETIATSLAASTTALNQSRTGEYDLSQYFLSGASLGAPSCADFIGPVEIGRVNYGAGRRGLFATRNIKAGDLLLVSNPLAISRQKVPGNHLASMPTFVRGLVSLKTRAYLVSELAKRVGTSKRQKAQLFSLCRGGTGKMEIPSMEIFRAGSEWVPEDCENFEVESDGIGEIVLVNGVGDVYRFLLPDGRTLYCDLVLGIWPLPSFVNHSCSPNVICANVGDAFFFRPSVDILKGEELTISYLNESDLFEGVNVRQAATETGWDFKCKCSRCLLEETLQQKLSNISNKFCQLVMDGESEFPEMGRGGRSTKKIAKLVDEIEVVVQSKNSKLGHKEQGWIRAQFLLAYISKFDLAVVKPDSQSLWTLILDSTISVSLGPLALKQAAKLLKLAGRWHPKRSQSYRLILDRVLGIYRAYFGEQPKPILLKLIEANNAS